MKPKNHNRDTTIDEIHRTRQRMATQFDGDIAAILEDARKRQAASGRAVWRARSAKNEKQVAGEPVSGR
jgi:hypothetical protein